MALDLQFFVRKLVILVVLGDLGMQFNKGFFSLLTLFLILAPSPIMQQGICLSGKLHGKFQPRGSVLYNVAKMGEN